MPKNRNNLIFFSPVIPATTGNGLAMRAGMFLEALSLEFNIYLHVIPVSQNYLADVVTDFVRNLVDQVIVHDLRKYIDTQFLLISQISNPVQRNSALKLYPKPILCRHTNPKAIKEIVARFSEVAPAVVHVMRSYLAPYAGGYLQKDSEVTCVLDIDDIDSVAYQRIAELKMHVGMKNEADSDHIEASRLRILEENNLSGFDSVIVGSSGDASYLTENVFARKYEIIPNAIEKKEERIPEKSDTPTILFVGTLGYFPNEEGLLFFCRESLPLIQEKIHNVRVLIVGVNPGPEVIELAEQEGIDLCANVEDVSIFYQAATIAVVPVRAGGGTRIKIIEAFSYRVPVVSTAIGAEGLSVVNELSLLIADDKESLATACVKLIQDDALQTRLKNKALEYVKEKHNREEVMSDIRNIYSGL